MSIVQPRLQGFSVLEMAFILAAFIVCRASVPPNYSLLGHSRVSRRCSCRSPNYSLKWPLSLRPLLFFFKKNKSSAIDLAFLGLDSVANLPDLSRPWQHRQFAPKYGLDVFNYGLYEHGSDIDSVPSTCCFGASASGFLVYIPAGEAENALLNF